jgi:4-amino-4-deoxy-L-arabinose transferase-like glycosyltransferase
MPRVETTAPRVSGREPPPVPRWAARAVWLVLLLELALLLHSAWRVGPTYDEHFYVAAGVAYWDGFDFALNREHPPLAKLLIGLPLVLSGAAELPAEWQSLVDFPVAFFYELNASALDRNLFLARLGPVLLTVLLSFALARTAARRFGGVAGLVAALAFGLNPTVLAHGPLASLDVACAAFVFWAALAARDLFAAPSAAAALRAAVLFGLAHLTKFTALLLGPLFVALALIATVARRSLAPLAWCALALLGGLSVFAAGYAFEARSQNSAWSDARYVMDGVAPRAADAPPAEWAARARAAGLAPGVAQRIAGARDPIAAAEALAAVAPALPPGERESALALTASLGECSGELRKRASAALLDALAAGGPSVDAHAQRALEALTGVSCSSLASWRDWRAREEAADWNRRILTQGWTARLARIVGGYERPVPLLTALKGVDFQLYHGQFGHGSYFRGRRIDPGPRTFGDGNPWPEYYAVVAGIKNPLAWLALALAGFGCASWPRGSWRMLDVATCVLFPAAMFAAFSLGSALLGIKYLLPVYPFAALAIARLAASFPRAGLALAGAAVLESAWIHPHELMYYNLAAGGPARGPAISVVGDDWGQGVRAVGRWAAANEDALAQTGGLVYSPYSVGVKSAFGLDGARPMSGPTRGIVAVNLVNYYREQQEHAWLSGYEPFLVIDQSVLVFDTRVAPPGGDPLASGELAPP